MLEQAKGQADTIVGKVQEVAGKAMGDTSTQFAGTLRQAAGTAQQGYGDARDRLRDVTIDNPFVALGAAVAAGMVIGALLGRSR